MTSGGAGAEAEAATVEAQKGIGLVVCPRLELVVFVPPKNACSGVKEAIAEVERPGEAASSGISIHQFARRFDATRFDPQLLESYRWIAVLRNPYHRVVSAYFNKICAVRSAELYGADITLLQQRLGIPVSTARGVSFEEFVRGAELCAPDELDKHWRPQARLLGRPLSRFEFVGRVDDPVALTEGLERYGLNLRPAAGNPTRYRASSEPPHEAPWTLAAEHLRGKRIPKPKPEEMFSAELKVVFDRVYAADLALYAEAFGEVPRPDATASLPASIPGVGSAAVGQLPHSDVATSFAAWDDAFVDQVAASSSATTEQVRIITHALGDLLRERLSLDQRVLVPDLGVFAPRQIAARTRLLGGGKVQDAPERKVVVFKPRID